jgi:hypothetical protein
MAEPTTFEEFEDYVQKKAYLYPITSELLSWGRTENTPEFQYHQENIQKLWDKHGKAPIVEGIIGFSYYMFKTMDAIDNFCKEIQYSQRKQYSLRKQKRFTYEPTPVSLYSVTFSEEDQKMFESMPTENMYFKKFVDSTRSRGSKKKCLLKKSLESCSIFKKAKENNKRMYAIRGKPIHKWEYDEEGHIKHDKSGDFMMKLSDELIFWSVLCAPYRDPSIEFEKGAKRDYRFIADTELLDVVDDYKSKLEELVGKDNKKSKTKREKYERVLNSTDPIPPYGIHLDEVLKVRKRMRIKEGEAVYYISAELDCLEEGVHGWSAQEIVEGFVTLHDRFIYLYAPKNKLLKVAEDRFYSDSGYERIRPALLDCIVSRACRNEFLKLGDERIIDITNDNFLTDDEKEVMARNVLNVLQKEITVDRFNRIIRDRIFDANVHDKIPHSYIGAIFKSGELDILRDILEKEKTKEGYRNFEIKHPGVIAHYFPEENKTKISDFLALMQKKEDELIENSEGDPDQVEEVVRRKLNIPNIEKIKQKLEGEMYYFLGIRAKTDSEIKKGIEDLRNLNTYFGVDLSFYDKINEDGARDA